MGIKVRGFQVHGCGSKFRLRVSERGGVVWGQGLEIYGWFHQILSSSYPPGLVFQGLGLKDFGVEGLGSKGLEVSR